MKSVLRSKFIALNTYIRKEERPKTNDLHFFLMGLEKKEQHEPKANRSKK
jgi:hypothetical protein